MWGCEYLIIRCVSVEHSDGAALTDVLWHVQIPLSAYDNLLALDQMEVAYDTLLARPLASASEDSPGVFSSKSALVAKDGLVHPKVVSLGGDHTIVLPILRSLYKIYGPVSVIHFDSHMDTSGTRGAPPSPVTHGSYFFVAHEEGLLINDTNVHAGIRSKMNVSITILPGGRYFFLSVNGFVSIAAFTE